jgi:HD-GYP domain-containing protein (c-di-GMP phosphodiesterase class II)
MLTNNVLAVFDGIRQRHIVLLKKYTLLAHMHSLASKRALPDVAFATDEALLQSLLAAYDRGTSAHAQRIVLLAEGLAYQLHLADEEVFQVCLAALLHDIGKVGIPRAILNKRGPLNEQEQCLIRRHPEIGQQMLLLAGGLFARLAPIVVAHHESWDGGGYPANLAGEAIPLAARIIAVVDSYDAMTYRRVYHEPQTVVEACAELQRCAGSQYDPHIVAAFLALLSETTEPIEQHARRNRAAGGTASAGEVFAVPSPQSDGCVPVSA